MSNFRTITEAVLRNNTAGELLRVEVTQDEFGNCYLSSEWRGVELVVGDTITIEEREEEIE
jgi:hypothetical protein